MDRLDGEIAEKILGWKPWRSKHGYFRVDLPDGTALNSCDRETRPAFDPDTGEKLPEPLWWEEFDGCYWSSNIEAAMDVVEKLHQSDPPVFLVLKYMGRDLWLAQFTDCSPNTIGIAKGATAPLAICLAALETVAALAATDHGPTDARSPAHKA